MTKGSSPACVRARVYASFTRTRNTSRMTSVVAVTAMIGGTGEGTIRNWLRGDSAHHYPKPAPLLRPSFVFESLRQSLNDLLARSTPPEERREIVSRMRDTLVQAKMGLQDLREALTKSRQRLEHERREVETVQRRKRLAEQIGDTETIRLAVQYEQLHAERVSVLTRKLDAQESELALAERDVAQMMAELRAAASGVGPMPDRTTASMNAAMDELETELGTGAGREPLREEIDALSRSRTRADREADAARKLEELKRRMGK